MPTRRINGVQLYWELSGERRAGHPGARLLGRPHNWALVVPRALETLQCRHLRPPRPQPQRTRGQGSIQDDVADLAALIEHLFGGPAHVIGNSFGAAIALNLAAQRPELIRSLVAHEPPLFGLLEGQTEVRPALAAVQRTNSRRRPPAAGRRFAGGARRFVETDCLRAPAPGTSCRGHARHLHLQCADLAG